MLLFAINMYSPTRNWEFYNNLLVNRGRIVTILIQPSLLEADAVKKMNQNKRGRPFRFPSALISAAFAVKCTVRFAYRQLEGFMKDISQNLDVKMPNFRTIWWRIDRMKNEGIKFSIREGKNTVVAIDSTGLRPVNDGEYRSMKYDTRKEWIKLHAVVDVKTKEILNMSITKGNCGDNPQFKRLIKPIAQNVSAAFADKAYDSVEAFDFCERNNIFAGIPVRLNATNLASKSKMRRKMIEAQLGLIRKPGYNKRHRHISDEKKLENQERWKRSAEYGRRSQIESAFSRYKRVLGENVFSKKTDNIEKEIAAKINILNRFAVMR